MPLIYLQTLTLLFVAIAGNLLAKERILGTKVLIDPPSDFVKAKQFPGYMMESTGSSIMVTPMPGGPLSGVSQGFNRAELATQGMKLLKKEEMKVGTADAFLIHASQRAYGTEFLKWMLVFGDASETVLVVATFPEQFQDQLSDKLKAAVLSSEWQKSMVIDFFEGSTFTVKEAGNLKFANKMGNNVLLTENGVFPNTEEGSPLVIVGSSISQNWSIPGDKQIFSNQRLKQTKILSNLSVTNEREVRIDDLDGYLSKAFGKDKDTGERIYIEQCLLFMDDGYYIFQAMVAANEKEKYESNFSKILESFKRK